MRPPIFILSMERSGSTLIRHLLGAHREIYAPEELHLGALCYQLGLTLSAGLEDADSGTAEIKTVTIRDLNLRTVRMQLSAPARLCIRRTVEALINPTLVARDKTILCEKTPQNCGYAELLHAVFPDARFICLYRDCYDVASSCIEAMHVGFGRGLAGYIRSGTGSIAETLVYAWMDKTSGMLQFEKSGALTMRVKYGNLARNPHEQLRSIFEFLQLDYSSDLTAQTFSIPSEQRPGRGDHKFLTTTKVHAESIGRADRIRAEILPNHLASAVQGLLGELKY